LRSQDRLIISTAIPQITDAFHSADDIGWYGTAYLLTNCAFQLLFGKLYTVFSIKATFLTSILLFEAGSTLCGAATNSIAFIFGRAIAGLGSGGILSGVVRFYSPLTALFFL
jgi:MFS family permease